MVQLSDKKESLLDKFLTMKPTQRVERLRKRYLGIKKPEMNIVKIHRPQKLNLVW